MSQVVVDDDEYGDDTPADWHYGAQEPARYPPLKYNWETHCWECGCSTFAYAGKCKHANRVRREELVEVNERFL